MASVDESVVSGVSATSAPTFNTIVVYTSTSSASETPSLGLSILQQSSASTANAHTIDHYARLASSATATGTNTPTVRLTKIEVSNAGALSRLVAVYNNTATNSVTATNTVNATNDFAPLISTATASSSATNNATALGSLVSLATSYASVTLGLFEVRTSSATATSLPDATRVVTLALTSGCTATASVISHGSTLNATLFSAASAASLATTQHNMTAYVRSAASAASSVFYKDPNQLAYVMNTETEALSMYNNFSFDSLAYVDGVCYAAGPDGFYKLEGADDDGEDVDAELTTGFTDLGEQHTKHAGSLYLGYTSDGPTTVSVDTYGMQHPTQISEFDELDQLDALAPRNNRVKLAKGLNSRYWRITIRNKNGSHFEINDVAIDVAVSNRRI